MLLVDSSITEAKATPEICINGGQTTIKVTDNMIALVKEAMQETGMSAEEAAAEIAYLQEEGDILP
jgi:hypothetical protein